MRSTLLLALCVALAPAASADPDAIFLVRHAERADAGGLPQSDPNLSDAGRKRAADLAEELRDAKINAIFVTEYRRTQETAKPLEERLGIHATVIPAEETARLIATLKSSAGSVLIVGHSNTLPKIMEALGISSPTAMAERDYDDLFLLLREPEPRVVRLHYR